jgi:hypothetical protein
VPRSVGSALPVMMSAGTWPKTLALPRRILRPPEFPRSLAFLDTAGNAGLGHARAALQTTHGLAGSLLSNPAVRTFVCQRNWKAVCFSTSGKLPTTRSSLRRQLPNQLPSQLRSLRSQRQRDSQRQRSLGSQRQLGSRRSLCRSRRSLCRSRNHGLRVPSPEAFPRSLCRRRRTSPG